MHSISRFGKLLAPPLLGIFLALALISAPAVASSGNPVVAVHPLVLGGADKKEAPLLQAILKSELLRLGLELVDDALVTRFLAAEPRHSCAGNNECLARLAAASKAPVVFVLIHPFSTKIQMSGKLMQTDGVLARSFRNKESPRKAKQKLTAAVRQAFRMYLPTIVPETESGRSAIAKTESPELAPPLAPPMLTQRPPAVKPSPEAGPQLEKEEPPRTKREIPLPPPPLVSTKPPASEPLTLRAQPDEGLSGRQIFGIGTVSVGAAVAVVGGIFELQAARSWSDFDAFYRGGLPTRDQVGEMKRLSDRATSRQTMGATMLIGGGAMVAGGAYLFFFGKSSESGGSSVSAAVQASPRSVSLHLKFP